MHKMVNDAIWASFIKESFQLSDIQTSSASGHRYCLMPGVRANLNKSGNGN